MKYLHIDKNVTIRTDEEARVSLRSTNDQSYLTPGQGIVQVPMERWVTAQEAERTHWMVRGLRTWNDRNDQHFKHFDGYASLQGHTFKHAIELGCGPFTNLAIIGGLCIVDECDLLDPLIEQYLDHPYCSYNKDHLFVRPPKDAVHLFNRLAARFMPSVHRTLFRQKPNRKRIPVIRLLAEPAEKLAPPDDLYDLVILINVIEHCYDVPQIFHNILTDLKSGGILVFHDKLYHHNDVLRSVEYQYDAAHPLKADESVIGDFINRFTELHRKDVKEEITFMDQSFNFDTVYFIGQKP